MSRVVDMPQRVEEIVDFVKQLAPTYCGSLATLGMTCRSPVAALEPLSVGAQQREGHPRVADGHPAPEESAPDEQVVDPERPEHDEKAEGTGSGALERGPKERATRLGLCLLLRRGALGADPLVLFL